MTVTIGVVIPFYQKGLDILSRCLASVIAQAGIGDARFIIVIVDDESPLPLSDALQGVSIPAPHELIRLSRKNGGPGAARNTALDYLAQRQPDFVAFIDSDDSWRPHHIGDGLAILADDADFYFCDHDRWDYPASYLEDSVQFQRWSTTPDSCLVPIDRAQDGIARSFEFRAGEAFYAFIEDYLAQTSTVIYRFAPCAGVRFDPGLRHAGEDNMFWLDLTKSARKVRVSAAKNVLTGKGVNMFAGSMQWSHPQAAQRTAAQVWFFIAIGDKFGTDARARSIFTRRLNWHEAEFSHVWIRRMLRDPLDAVRVIAPLLRAEPALPFRLIQHIVRGDINRNPRA